jgi:hypothetical protein
MSEDDGNKKLAGCGIEWGRIVFEAKRSVLLDDDYDDDE